MTSQELLNMVWMHLRTQNAKSIDKYDVCLYRGPDGLKCAIGILIPDELYKPSMEGIAADALGSISGLIGDENLTLAARLQHVHDNLHVEDWEFELADVAEEFGLEPLP